MSNLISQIEGILQQKIHLAPVREGNPLAALMPYKENYPKYALDSEGNIIGLNLANTGLTDEKWHKILELVGYNLQQLNLSENELTESPILSNNRFLNLQILFISDNKIKEFLLPEGMDALEDIDLEGNPLVNPSEEIIKQGKSATLRFLKELRSQGVNEIYEVKMLIVGEGETGKTTLWNLLQDPNHPVPDPNQKSTVGIRIKEGWTFEHLNIKNKQFLVNLWDFGGQDIQYMTHQFFLTKRSFYVLLADGRREVSNFAYWFKIINLLGCEENTDQKLPVLVVLNEKGNAIARMPYNTETISEEYPKLDIIKREVDFAKKDGRFEALRSLIQTILCNDLSHLPLKFPSNWNKVRLELYKLRLKTNHIDAKQFETICILNEVISAQSQKDLSQWLHDLGVILHFHADVTLADFIVLNPQWAANAVYEIMKHKDIKDNGRFSMQIIGKIWTECKYTPVEQTKLLNLMLRDSFEVCFKSTEQGKEIYIAPQLLPDKRPIEYQWEAEVSTLRYTYQYPFMPNGIVGRLIVRLHEDIEILNDNKIVWLKGTILKKEDCRARIYEDNDASDGRKLIKIEVQGEQIEDRKNVLRDIRQELDRIHQRSFPSLKIFQKIPCNCKNCINSMTPHEYDFDVLKIMERNKVPTTQCQKPNFETVQVSQLLEGVFVKTEMMREVLETEINQPIINVNIENIMPKQDPIPTNDPSSTLFTFLTAFVVVAAFVLVLLKEVDLYKAIFAVVAIILFITVLGAFQLINDKKASDKTFLELMGMVFKKLPPMSFFTKK
jgi:internalin A